MILKKLIFFISLASFAINACHTNATQTIKTQGKRKAQTEENKTGPLALTFSKPSYLQSDSIRSAILNKTDSDIVVGLRCGYYLEMSYQKLLKGQWSENKEFSYMMLRCPTHAYTIKPHEKYDFSLPATLFSSTGSFRLLIPFIPGTENSAQTLTSIPFEIR